MKRKQKQPILDAIESRDRDDAAAVAERRAERNAMCKTVRRAMAEIGVAKGEGAERVAILIALVAGRGTLERTVAQIADDKEVQLTQRHVRDLLDELVEWGVIARTEKGASPYRRRGPKATVWMLSVRWEFLGEVLAKSSRASADTPAVEIGRWDGDDAEVTRRRDGGDAEMGRSCDGGESKHSLYPLPNPNIPGPLSPSQANRKSKGPEKDHKDLGTKHLSRDQVAEVADRIFASLRYDGDNGRTLWHVAAAHVAGLVSEFAIKDACKAAVELSSRDRVGYFRRVVAERCDTDKAGLARLLSCVRIDGGLPSSRPTASRPVASAAFRKPPAETCPRGRYAEAERRQELARQLGAMQ